ncbi:hypothetical protein ACE38W_00630 [Chitinophaga sp. Hz27]|uniref:hypothetical protein n=1 Tax=Chitinophaga sp. Hz27 TaxID=3347169 RepID=UPI0035E0B3EE
MMETTNEIQVYENAVETFRGGSAVLAGNQAIVSRALAAGQSLLASIKDNGGKLDKELDELSNHYLAKVNTRKKELDEARKPITQLMDMLKKMFTCEEAKLDITAAGTIPYQIQQYRNAYAKELAEAERKRQLEADRRATIAREEVALRAEIEKQLSDYFNNHLLSIKQQMHSAFSTITLEDYDKRADGLRSMQPAYKKDHYESFTPTVTLRLLTTEKYQEILGSVHTAVKRDQLAAEYTAQVGELQRYLVDRLPSKKAELEAMATAATEELERMEKERQEREAAEKQKIEADAAAAQQKAEQEIALQKSADETVVMFDQAAAVAESSPASKSRQGFEITVSHAAGYVQIFQHWFENEGKNIPLDKMGNTKLDQMKAWCEKHAHKTGEIISSQYLRYEPTYKAVNRK